MICDDTGWKTIDVDGVARVTRCDCVRESSSARLLADARIPRRYQHCDFDNFLAYNEQLNAAQQYARRLTERFPVVDKGLFLQGPPGVGKTHLAVAVLRQAVRTRGARGIDDWEQRLNTALVKSSPTDLVRHSPETKTPDAAMQNSKVKIQNSK